jgi:hypothetical protein
VSGEIGAGKELFSLGADPLVQGPSGFTVLEIMVGAWPRELRLELGIRLDTHGWEVARYRM